MPTYIFFVITIIGLVVTLLILIIVKQYCKKKPRLPTVISNTNFYENPAVLDNTSFYETPQSRTDDNIYEAIDEFIVLENGHYDA